MKPILALMLSLAVSLGAMQAAMAGETPEPVGPNLPPRLRGLLVQEMTAILGASKDIVEALVRGRDEVVAEKAQSIHDSFILKQKMTQADREALKEAAPAAFVQRDRAFHELTGRLAQAAREGSRDRTHALFAQMINACTACHARYATDRFAGFGR
ncbi:MAG TPA: cytochrome c [Gammaproteobacteria bacterium]|nr:cytochrome c [Gammaproteobacteria bacterium]